MDILDLCVLVSIVDFRLFFWSDPIEILDFFTVCDVIGFIFFFFLALSFSPGVWTNFDHIFASKSSRKLPKKTKNPNLILDTQRSPVQDGSWKYYVTLNWFVAITSCWFQISSSGCARRFDAFTFQKSLLRLHKSSDLMKNPNSQLYLARLQWLFWSSLGLLFISDAPSTLAHMHKHRTPLCAGDRAAAKLQSVGRRPHELPLGRRADDSPHRGLLLRRQ